VLTSSIALLLAASITLPAAGPTAADPAVAAGGIAARPQVADSDLALWVVQGLTSMGRNTGESAEELMLRNDRRPDLDIATEVTGKLTAAGLQGMVVASVNGEVVLRGEAADAARRDRAVALAQEVPGVRSVNNLLRLPGEPLVKTPGAAPPAPPAATGPARTEPFAFLTTDARAGRGIVAYVDRGVVHLFGEVNNLRAREYASAVASRVPGVRAVHTNLSIRQGNLDDDRRLALLTHRILTNDVIVQTVSNAISVTVTDGILVLQGYVRDEDQREQAGRLASFQTGVFAVVNDLVVDRNFLAGPRGRIEGFRLWKD